MILHFNLSVNSSDIIQGLLDGTTLSPSPDWPPLKIGPFLGRLSSKPKDLHIAILSLSQGLSCWIIWITWMSSWRVLAWPVWWLQSCRFPYFLWLWRLKPSQLQGVFSGIYQECCSKQVCLDLFHYQIISNPINSFFAQLPQIAFVMESVFLAMLLALQSMVVWVRYYWPTKTILHHY